jgi:hypothetical protein
MVQSKILRYYPPQKNLNQFMQFVLEVAVLECSFLKHSQGILGVKLTFFLVVFIIKGCQKKAHELNS